MSNRSVSLQVGLDSVANNSLTTLSAFQPLLKAISADDVSPLAVLQIQEIGTLFHSNGEMARMMPDLMMNSKSFRLEKLKLYVGWMKYDTASTLAQSAVGRTATLLSLILCELYGAEKASEAIFDLSQRCLPPDSCNASIFHLQSIMSILSQKVSGACFGTHYAQKLTMLRQILFSAGYSFRFGDEALESLPNSTMLVDLLDNLSKALIEEATIFMCKGYSCIGSIAALVTALCPEDVYIVVRQWQQSGNGGIAHYKDEIIFSGKRKNIVIILEIQAQKENESERQSQTTFWLEQKHDSKVPLVSPISNLSSELRNEREFLRFKLRGSAKQDLSLYLQSFGYTIQILQKITPKFAEACAVAHLLYEGLRTQAEFIELLRPDMDPVSKERVPGIKMHSDQSRVNLICKVRLLFDDENFGFRCDNGFYDLYCHLLDCLECLSDALELWKADAKGDDMPLRTCEKFEALEFLAAPQLTEPAKYRSIEFCKHQVTQLYSTLFTSEKSPNDSNYMDTCLSCEMQARILSRFSKTPIIYLIRRISFLFYFNMEDLEALASISLHARLHTRNGGDPTTYWNSVRPDPVNLHEEIITMFLSSREQSAIDSECLGTCEGVNSVFPSFLCTLRAPSYFSTPGFRILPGSFHDGKRYFKSIFSGEKSYGLSDKNVPVAFKSEHFKVALDVETSVRCAMATDGFFETENPSKVDHRQEVSVILNVADYGPLLEMTDDWEITTRTSLKGLLINARVQMGQQLIQIPLSLLAKNIVCTVSLGECKHAGRRAGITSTSEPVALSAYSILPNDDSASKIRFASNRPGPNKDSLLLLVLAVPVFRSDGSLLDSEAESMRTHRPIVHQGLSCTSCTIKACAAILKGNSNLYDGDNFELDSSRWSDDYSAIGTSTHFPQLIHERIYDVAGALKFLVKAVTTY